MKNVIVFLLIFFPTIGFCWGHSSFYKFGEKGLNDARTNLALVAIKNKKIRFCVNDPSNAYDHLSIAIQMRGAVRLWLVGLLGENQGNELPIHQADCSEIVDLELQILRFKGPYDLPSGPGEQESQQSELGLRAVIVLNYDFSDNLTPRKVNDLFRVLGVSPSQRDELVAELSKSANAYSIEKLASRYQVNANDLYANSYSFIVHEMGHAFGQCDTYFPMTCDKNFSSAKHGDSIMDGTDIFFLSPDDLLGIRKMRERVISKEFDQLKPARSWPKFFTTE